MKIPAYLIDVLRAMKDWHDEKVWFDVEHCRASFYRIETPDGLTTIVDTERRLIDDSLASPCCARTSQAGSNRSTSSVLNGRGIPMEI